MAICQTAIKRNDDFTSDWFKVDDDGLLRCRGYIHSGFADYPLDECEACKHFFYELDPGGKEFWSSGGSFSSKFLTGHNCRKCYEELFVKPKVKYPNEPNVDFTSFTIILGDNEDELHVRCNTCYSAWHIHKNDEMFNYCPKCSRKIKISPKDILNLSKNIDS